MQNDPIVIAGPCSAESAGQMMECARSLSAAGVGVLRAGAWKPRTKPGGFEGYGTDALRWIADAAAAYGMRSATEVATPAHVDEALAAGIDMLWIGARTTANPFAVQDIADALRSRGAADIPVLVKNPVSPDLELWIGAIERLRAAGVERLTAVHRGFSDYGEHYYRNAPLWRVPIELRRRMPQLPLLCDPSHIAGRSEIVGDVARRAIEVGFDGLMVEVHPAPAQAMSDARQQLTPAEFAAMLATLRRPGAAAGTHEALEAMRAEIDSIDDRLLGILAERMRVSDTIGRLKQREGMAVVQPDRYRELIDRRCRQGAGQGYRKISCAPCLRPSTRKACAASSTCANWKFCCKFAA